jgi:hypothetical protein
VDLTVLLPIQAGPDPRAPHPLPEPGRSFAAPLTRGSTGFRVGGLDDLGGLLIGGVWVKAVTTPTFADRTKLWCGRQST